MLMLAVALAVAAPSPDSLVAPRKAYAACLKAFEMKSASDKMAADAYAEAVKTACPTELETFKAALIRFDTGMGTKRAVAEANAQRDVEDYWAESSDRFKDR
ncbi:hypothetical protein [Sphingomonas jaspsi]|uniref:hypothetical protein n=1 Tax=Sphingomonas jaspsi TaxID=392409 RepID=UPI0004ACE206|nr:hypothetical protein [Sphingomonas jaspsi]